MSDTSALIHEHPVLVASAVIGVVLLAYMQSRGNASAPVEYTFAGGGHAAPIDPSAAAISEAAIGAGVSNLGAIAQLLGQQDNNSTALTASLASTNAAETAALASTEASRQTGLAGISASLKAALAQTEEQAYATGIAGDVANHQTDASVSINSADNAAAITAANINAAIQMQAINAASKAAALQAQNDQFAIQASKDKARAAANTSIFSDILHVGASLLTAFL